MAHKFERRHYQCVAETLASVINDIDAARYQLGDDYHAQLDAIERTVVAFSKMFRRDNSRFSESRFVGAVWLDYQRAKVSA